VEHSADEHVEVIDGPLIRVTVVHGYVPCANVWHPPSVLVLSSGKLYALNDQAHEPFTILLGAYEDASAIGILEQPVEEEGCLALSTSCQVDVHQSRGSFAVRKPLSDTPQRMVSCL
jgi:hypothetical protein